MMNLRDGQELRVAQIARAIPAAVDQKWRVSHSRDVRSGILTLRDGRWNRVTQPEPAIPAPAGRSCRASHTSDAFGGVSFDSLGSGHRECAIQRLRAAPARLNQPQAMERVSPILELPAAGSLP